MQATELGEVGSSLDQLRKDEDADAEVGLGAVKRVLSAALSQEIERQNTSKAEIARRMGVSRIQVYRLLDPDHHGVTLETMHRAARALGRKLVVDLA